MSATLTSLRRAACCGALALLMTYMPGCSRGDAPELGRVKGQVKLNGEPLVGVIVQFMPETGGRMSSAMTEADGWYDLIYSTTEAGAKVGPHIVALLVPEGSDLEKQLGGNLPAKYNDESELKKEVVEGDNVIDFDLMR